MKPWARYLLIILAILQLADFLAAPQTVPGWVKSQISFQLVKTEIRQTFKRGGVESLKSRYDNQIVDKFGYHYTVEVNEVGDRHRVISTSISQYPSEAAVEVGYFRHLAMLEGWPKTSSFNEKLYLSSLTLPFQTSTSELVLAEYVYTTTR
ncbi:MAG: hypothetical protein V1846_02850 [Candidatus Komeilibacteria bacterium]